MVRPAYVHPSGLSPAEDEAYSAWIVELEGQVSKLGRGLRFGEMLGFVRKRTPVEREPEIMSYFGSMAQQQSLGVGEFVAILRLVGPFCAASMCVNSVANSTGDHIFIQTHPLVLTKPLSPKSSNPFFRSNDVDAPALLSAGGESSARINRQSMQQAAARKKWVPPPPPPPSSSQMSIIQQQQSASPPYAVRTRPAAAAAAAAATPQGQAHTGKERSAATPTPDTPQPGGSIVLPPPSRGNNPYRQAGHAPSPIQTRSVVSEPIAKAVAATAGTGRLPPTPPDSLNAARSPPLPPRPVPAPSSRTSLASPCMPKSVGPTETPSKPSVMQRAAHQQPDLPDTSKSSPTKTGQHPALPARPASMEIISSSSPLLIQLNHTGQSNASNSNATSKQQLGNVTSGTSTPKIGKQNTGSKKVNASDSIASLRLMGSSHIGVDAKPLRKVPSSSLAVGGNTMVRSNSSSDECHSAASVAAGAASTPMMHKNPSESSLSSLSAARLPRVLGAETASTSVTTPTSLMGSEFEGSKKGGQWNRKQKEREEQTQEILSWEFTAPSNMRANVNTDGAIASSALPGMDALSTGTSTLKSTKPPAPPPPRRRPESLHVAKNPVTGAQKLVFGAEPGAAHPSPFTATTIQSSVISRSSSRDHRPSAGHARSSSSGHVFPTVSTGPASAATSGAPFFSPSPSNIARRNTTRSDASRSGYSAARNNNNNNNLDAVLKHSKDASQEWLEKARAGMSGMTAAAVPILGTPSSSSSPSSKDILGGTRALLARATTGLPTSSIPGAAAAEDTQGLLAAGHREQGRRRRAARRSGGEDEDSEAINEDEEEEEEEDDDDYADGSELDVLQRQRSLQERKRELERLRSEGEHGWTRLD